MVSFRRVRRRGTRGGDSWGATIQELERGPVKDWIGDRKPNGKDKRYGSYDWPQSEVVLTNIVGGKEGSRSVLKIKSLFDFFFDFFFVFIHMHLFKVERQPSSVSSTHPAIKISIPRDYHHFSQVHPPPELIAIS